MARKGATGNGQMNSADFTVSGKVNKDGINSNGYNIGDPKNPSSEKKYDKTAYGGGGSFKPSSFKPSSRINSGKKKLTSKEQLDGFIQSLTTLENYINLGSLADQLNSHIISIVAESNRISLSSNELNTKINDKIKKLLTGDAINKHDSDELHRHAKKIRDTFSSCVEVSNQL